MFASVPTAAEEFVPVIQSSHVTVTAKRTIRAPWKESAFPQKSYTKPR